MCNVNNGKNMQLMDQKADNHLEWPYDNVVATAEYGPYQGFFQDFSQGGQKEV